MYLHLYRAFGMPLDSPEEFRKIDDHTLKSIIRLVSRNRASNLIYGFASLGLHWNNKKHFNITLQQARL